MTSLNQDTDNSGLEEAVAEDRRPEEERLAAAAAAARAAQRDANRSAPKRVSAAQIERTAQPCEKQAEKLRQRVEAALTRAARIREGAPADHSGVDGPADHASAEDTLRWRVIMGPGFDLYGAVVEYRDDGSAEVTYGGLSRDEFIAIGVRNAANGYGAVLLGRVDPTRRDQPPHKTPWLGGYHGNEGRYGGADELDGWVIYVVRAIAIRGERGILNIGARLPVGEVGVDVDGHSGKRGLITTAEHEKRCGPLPPTYIVTAREYETGSGIRLYRVPDDWRGPGALKTLDGCYGNVDLIQPHLRYVVAPGGCHHTGATYRLYGPDGGEITSGTLPSRDELPWLPKPWLEALYRRPRRSGAMPDIEDITAVANEWVFDNHPRQLAKTVAAVRCATEEGQTRPAFHRALWIAARKARAGCYPFSRAVAEIEAAAVAAYAERGLELDYDDFAASIEHAVTEALDMTDAETAAWAIWQASDEYDIKGVLS